jgi:small conductance mechanosensitive channel
VAAQLAEDPDWKDQISEPPQLLGVERLEQSGVRLRLWIRTLPLKQWGVAREFRHRLKGALDAAGIEPGVPQQVIRRG